MFNFCKEKDKKIAKLEQRIKELEREKLNEDKILDEINEVLKKFERGLFDISIKSSSNNHKINEILKNLNQALQTNSRLSSQAVEVLIEYGNANYTYNVDVSNLTGKLGSIILGIRALGSSINEILAIIDKTANELNRDMMELSSAATQLSNASNAQAASLEETAAALEEVTSTIANNSENAIKMANISNEVSEVAQKGAKLAKSTYESMESINEQVNLISEAIKVIDQIAFQTNILSLNAAVEAATAGEAGKGFAVVAGEVRNLASRSAEAANEIKKIVETATMKSHNGKEIADQMIKGYENLNNKINEQLEIIKLVSNASKEQKEAIEQINDEMQVLQIKFHKKQIISINYLNI